MDNETKEIINMVNVDKRVTALNSVIMEKDGFRLFDSLLQELPNLDEVFTDAHNQMDTIQNWQIQRQ
ncbi:unnamed protein product [Knipowitschia caucasica]